ncbi:asparagine synthase-related protein [Actinomadura algeriensis]|uniref:Asparagine synthase (Glutamine-hydrolyzing) n=1 Tax=Actinomadura algeriensis TaxID=1679523 RepID=A0ABR9K275_9ACTN|nr:asparagine synthase-related protein [Actinomadura algeriensis]MBE1536703.1 asparagine synthase (glutamine-hydrolyzing) [Actinomadura algeriensis]
MRFVVVPDNAAGEAVAAALRDRPGLRTLDHESGRPWIAGWWRDEEVAWAAAGRRRIAVLGTASVTGPWLARYIARLRDPGGLNDLWRELPGGFHTIAMVDGTLCVQGSLSRTRAVFYGEVLGTVVAADRPDTLAALTGAGVREESLAVGLMAPAQAWPLSERCPWEGVEAVPADHRLEIAPRGRVRLERRHLPPAPEVPLAAGAERLRRALHDAVAVRAHGRTSLSADLSGGMDSTSMCFLAAGKVERLLTVRCETSDPGDDDGHWAGLAAAALPNARYMVHATTDFPANFAGLLETDPDLEAPSPVLRNRAALGEEARLLSAAGSTLHLTGHGGDELFYPNPAYLYDMLRRSPLPALRRLRANRAVYRWKTRPTVRELLDRTSFSDWLGRDVGRALDASVRDVTSTPLKGWGMAYRMPDWATSDAVDSVRRTLRRTAEAGVEPLSPLRGQHLTLQCVREGGALIRRMNRITSRHGVTIDAPFLDDQVIEAALAIDYAECLDADRYKPALVEAMRGIVPDENLGRRTKAEFSGNVYAGLRRHRAELLELCDGMRLAELGLVDAAALREVLLSLPPFSLRLVPLVNTFACEVWLRSLPGGSRAAIPAMEEAR